MSTWTDFRDAVVQTLKVEEVTEELKTKVTQSIIDNVFPAIEDAVNHFISKVREQAPGETGWCRIRDGIVLPLVMEGLVYVAKMVLTKSLTKN